jgi:Domain of unknown function (DUF4129)
MKTRLLALIAILILCEAAGAATLLNYEGRVVRAAEQVKRIKTDEAYSGEGVATIRKLLPESEQVSLEDRTFIVDNAWLHGLLDSYESASGPQQRNSYLEEVEGRLRALNAHLRQSEEASTEGASGQPRERIREILSRPEFQPKQESRIARFFKEVWKTITDFIGELWSALRRLISGLFGSGSGGSWLVRIIVIAGLAVAFMFIIRALASRGPRKKRFKKRTVLGEEIESGATPRDLVSSAMEAAARGEYRRAMRGLYIALLFDMAERRLIELDDSATNREYLARVSRFNTLAPSMRYLTERFDYFWYGMFSSTEADFSSYLSRYKEAAAQVEQLTRQQA